MKGLLIVLSLSLSLQVQAATIEPELYESLKKTQKTKSEKDIVTAASKILAIDENDFLALNTLAIFYYEAKKYNMAKLILERALKAHPNRAELKNNLALVHFQLDNKKLGLQNLKEAAQNSDSEGEANLNLSSIYVEHRDYQKALGPLSNIYPKIRSKLATKSRAATALANNYAVALLGTGDKDKAEKVFKEATVAGIRDTNLLFNYATFLVEQGKDKEEAYKMISRLKFLSDDRNLLRKVDKLEKTLDNKK